MNKNLLQFHELKDNIFYRVLHNGERDHGYNYVLKEGRLYNQSKQRYSSLGYGTTISFISTDVKIMSFDSMSRTIEFHSKGLKVGCQDISIDDAKSIAFEILDRY